MLLIVCVLAYVCACSRACVLGGGIISHSSTQSNTFQLVTAANLSLLSFKSSSELIRKGYSLWIEWKVVPSGITRR